MFGHRYYGSRFYGPRYFGDGGSNAPPAPAIVDRGGAVRRPRKLRARDPWKEREEEAARERAKDKAIVEGILASIAARARPDLFPEAEPSAPAAPESERDSSPTPSITETAARAASRPALALVRPEPQLPPGPDPAALEQEFQAKRRSLINRQNAFIILISS